MAACVAMSSVDIVFGCAASHGAESMDLEVDVNLSVKKLQVGATAATDIIGLQGLGKSETLCFGPLVAASSGAWETRRPS